jgi:hypothetical protein
MLMDYGRSLVAVKEGVYLGVKYGSRGNGGDENKL